jgi:hypothetical protein
MWRFLPPVGYLFNKSADILLVKGKPSHKSPPFANPHSCNVASLNYKRFCKNPLSADSSERSLSLYPLFHDLGKIIVEGKEIPIDFTEDNGRIA